MPEAGQGAATATTQATGATQEQALKQAQGAQVPGTTPGSPTTNAVSDAAKEAARKLKIKHQDGNEEEVDEEEVIKIYRERKGHQRAANKELQEGRAAKKQSEEFIKMMRDRAQLKEALVKMGYSKQEIRSIAEEVLAAELEDELMDPKEKDYRDKVAKLKHYEELEKRQKEAQQKKIEDAMKAKFREKYESEFVDALKTEKLPANKAIVAEMAKYIHRAAQLKEQLTPAEAAKLVRQDIEEKQKSLYGESDAETLVRLLGDQGLQKIRQWDTARLKDPNSGLKTPTNQPEIGQRRRNTTKPMSAKEWREFNRK